MPPPAERDAYDWTPSWETASRWLLVWEGVMDGVLKSEAPNKFDGEAGALTVQVGVGVAVGEL